MATCNLITMATGFSMKDYITLEKLMHLNFLYQYVSIRFGMKCCKVVVTHYMQPVNLFPNFWSI